MSQIATVSDHLSHLHPYCDSCRHHPTRGSHHTAQATQNGPKVQGFRATLCLPSPGGLGFSRRCVCFTFSLPTSPDTPFRLLPPKSLYPKWRVARHRRQRPMCRVNHAGLNDTENERKLKLKCCGCNQTVAKSATGSPPMPTSISPS